MSNVDLHEHVLRQKQLYVDHCRGACKSSKELFFALLEVESRYDKQQGTRTDLHELQADSWKGYLEKVGVPFGTYRSWKHRILGSKASKKSKGSKAKKSQPDPNKNYRVTFVISGKGLSFDKVKDKLCEAFKGIDRTLIEMSMVKPARKKASKVVVLSSQADAKRKAA